MNATRMIGPSDTEIAAAKKFYSLQFYFKRMRQKISYLFEPQRREKWSPRGDREASGK